MKLVKMYGYLKLGIRKNYILNFIPKYKLFGKSSIKLIGLLILLSIIFSHQALSVPSAPYELNITQPNGEFIIVKQIGDENGFHFEALDGSIIIRNSSGRVIQPSISKVEKSISLPKVNDLRKSITTTGTKKVLVILINFTNIKPQRNESYFRDFVFNKSTNSLKKYYNEVSYNKLDIVGSVTKWYNSSHTQEYYGGDSINGVDDANGNIFELAREAVKLADPDVNFSEFANENGIVENLIIVHAGDGQEGTGVNNDIWSHFWSIYNYYGGSWHRDGIEVDGVRVIDYVMVAENSPLGTFTHEFGHSLGLPDLYNTETGRPVTWYWDLMDAGCWNNMGNTPSQLSAWNKIFLGWMNPILINYNTNVNITNLESNSEAYKVTSSDMSKKEYFLVENRQLIGFDRFLPRSGLLIWHIDESRGNISENKVNTGVIKSIIPEDASNGLIVRLVGATYAEDYNLTAFTPETRPSSNTNDNLGSGIWIYNISKLNMSMNFTIQVKQKPVDVFISPPFKNVTKNSAFYLNITVYPSGKGISAGSIKVSFNSTAINALSVSAGDLLGSTPLAPPGHPIIDNINGTITYDLARTGATTPPTPNGTFAAITFNVTSKASKGNSTIALVKASLSDESFNDITGISVNNGIVNVKVPSSGDANGDGIVDYKDLAILGANYGKSQGQTGYDARADFNGDGTVDYKDLAILGAKYGTFA